MQPLQGYPAVCFDLDGVLIDSMPWHAKAWAQAASAFGLKAPESVIYSCEGERGRLTAARLARLCGRRLSGADVSRLLALKEEWFHRFAAQIRVHRPLDRLIRRLRLSGIRLALVTGTSRPEVVRVVSRRLLEQFEVVITGDSVGHGKPHPEPYRRAFRALQTAPGCCLVVENAPYGIQSARGADTGFVLAISSSLPARYLKDADRIVASVPQLCLVIEQLTGTSRRRYNAPVRPVFHNSKKRG